VPRREKRHAFGHGVFLCAARLSVRRTGAPGALEKALVERLSAMVGPA